MRILGADLFCGAGGFSAGFIRAMRKLGYEFDLAAVNHWVLAIATHKLNHPQVRHFHSDLERIDPLEVVPGGYLDILIGAPECTYYSNALGGKPVNNQSRATPKWILKWAKRLNVKKIIIENVPEFRGWGPVHRTCICGIGVNVDARKHHRSCHFQKPIKSRKGQFFRNYIKKLQDIGYTVEYRVLCAADYGDPTTRRRLFIIAIKGAKRIVWPEPTYHQKGGDLRGRKKKWKTARKYVIDWSIPGKSIFDPNQKPLKPNTLKRIMAGLKRFSGLEPFMLSNQSGALPRSVNMPVPTLTANGSVRLYQPFLITHDQGGGVRSVDRPLHTLTSAEATGIVQPYLISLRGTDEDALNNTARSVDEPVPTITGGGGHIGLAQPFIIPYYSENGKQKARSHSIDDPFPTVVSANSHALVEPFLFSMEHTSDDGRVRHVDQPVFTISGSAAIGVVEPFMVEYHNTGNCHPVSEPTPTITGNDCLGLAMPVVQDRDGQKYLVDIRYRMFLKHEYARAQGLTKGYKFVGGSKAVMKQIGNMVPKGLAAALCETVVLQ